MIRPLHAATALCALALAGAVQAAAPVRTWVSPETGVGPHRSVDQALAAPFDAAFQVQRTDGRKVQVRTCKDYLTLGSGIADTLSEADFQALAAQGRLCRALQLAHDSRPATRSFLAGFSLKDAGPAALPPEFEMVVSDEEVARMAKLSKAGASLAKADPDARATGGGHDLLKLRGSGWEGTYKVLLRGYDLNGDGAEDLLVEAMKAVTTGGSLVQGQLLYLTRTAPGAPLRVFKHSP